MAIKAAETAWPMWRRTPAPKRGEILYRFGALMAEHKERLSQAMSREMGKVIAEARGDVQEGIDIAFLMAGEGRRMFGDTVPSELPDKWAMSIRQPIGVAGIITPVELPDRDSVLEDDARPRGRQHGRLQAGERHAPLRRCCSSS
jgi:aldehyde dehydrogenase (NAD+)